MSEYIDAFRAAKLNTGKKKSSREKVTEKKQDKVIMQQTKTQRTKT